MNYNQGKLHLRPMHNLSSSDKANLYNFLNSNGEGCETDQIIGNNIAAYIVDGKVIFMFSYYETDEVIEIFNVCTSIPYRKLGIAFRIMDHFIKSVKNKKIWLGIVSPHVVKLYAKLNFGTPILSSISPTGRTFPFYFVSLTHHHTAVHDVPFVSSQLLLFNKLLDNQNKLYFSRTLYDECREYLNLKYEIGYEVELSEFGVMDKKYGAKPIRGTSKGFGVALPNTNVANLHTHPAAAYEDENYEYAVGIHSLPDILALTFQPALFSFVVSVEGLFVLQKSRRLSTLMDLISTNKDFTEEVQKSITKFYLAFDNKTARGFNEIANMFDEEGDLPMFDSEEKEGITPFCKVTSPHLELTTRIHIRIKELLYEFNSFRAKHIFTTSNRDLLQLIDNVIGLNKHVYYLNFYPIYTIVKHPNHIPLKRIYF